MRGVYEKVKGSKDWYICYVGADGRRHRQHIGRYPDAVTAYDRKKQEACAIREGNYIEPAKPKPLVTFEELFRMRMADLKRDLSPKTFRHHEYDFNSPRLESLKKIPAAMISTRDIEAILSALYNDGRSGATIRNYRALISAVFAYGIEHEYLDAKNPVKKTRVPKTTKHRVRFLDHDEEEAIRGALRELCPEREAELDLLLHTGMRSGEAYGLTWDRVHLDRDRAVIEVPDAGKTGWRDIPVNSVCRQALETLQRQSLELGTPEYVVPRSGKEQNWALTKWFGDAVEKAGVLHATPHTLRHTFASRLVMNGVSLPRVQEYLGHATIAMTMKYTHLSREGAQADIERLVSPAEPAKRPPVRIRAAAAVAADVARRIA